MSRHLPGPIWALVRRLVPIACVDAVPVRRTGGQLRVGLIRRRSTDGPRIVWALVGGRVRRGETLRDALSRHMRETLGERVSAAVVDVTAPGTVAEYFPDPASPEALRDARQHAVALTYVVEVDGTVEPGGEALDFGWFDPATLPRASEFVPGHHAVLMRLIDRLQPGS